MLCCALLALAFTRHDLPIICYFKAGPRDPIPSLRFIQGCANQKCQRICKYTLHFEFLESIRIANMIYSTILNFIIFANFSAFRDLNHTIRKVKFLSKNSILTKRVFHPQFFLTIFLVKSKLSTA